MSFMEVYDKISFLLYLVTAELFICHRYGFKKYGAFRLIIGMIPVFLFRFFWSEISSLAGFPRTIWVIASQYIIAFALTLPVLAFSFNGDFWSVLFAGILAYCLQHISYQMFVLIRRMWGEIFPFLQSQWLLVLIFAAELLIIYLTFLRNQKKNVPIKVNNRVQVLLTALLLILVVYTSFFGITGASRSRDPLLFYVVLFYSISSGVLGAALEISLVTIRRQEVETAIMKQMVHQAKYQFQISKENIDLINIKCHDLRHQIRKLRGQVDKEALDQMEKAVAIYDASLCTGNDALDIILMEKELQCREANICLTSMFDAQVIRFMKDSDIYSLFGNIIENAMNSVRNLDPEKRCISLSGYYQAGWNVIREENYVEGEVVFKDGLPVTTKSADYHGFGVKSIQMIVEKYNGYFSFRQSGDIFRLEILFPEERGE